MENKEIASVSRITSELVGGFFLYGMILGIPYSILATVFAFLIKSSIIYAIINIILEAIYIFFVYKFSIKSTLKKRTVNPNDIGNVIKNFFIAAAVIYILSAVINFAQVNSKVDDAYNSGTTGQIENVLIKYYTSEELANYQKEKEETLSKVKKETYKNLVISEVIFLPLYIYITFMHKKTIIEYIN